MPCLSLGRQRVQYSTSSIQDTIDREEKINPASAVTTCWKLLASFELIVARDTFEGRTHHAVLRLRPVEGAPSHCRVYRTHCRLHRNHLGNSMMLLCSTQSMCERKLMKSRKVERAFIIPSSHFRKRLSTDENASVLFGSLQVTSVGGISEDSISNIPSRQGL